MSNESDPFHNGLYAGVDPQWQTDPSMLNGSYDDPDAPSPESEGDDTPPPPTEASVVATAGTDGEQGDSDALLTPPPLDGDSEPAESFDPGKSTVDEVNAYLADASDDERKRVLDLELEGKGRSGILSGPHAPQAGE